MRVLLATHLYPPRHTAGVEVFASVTGAHVAAAGHEVIVVTTEKDIAQPDLSTREREHGGLRVIEVINNLFAPTFEETWRRPAMDRVLAGVLDDVRPDVVHVHHLLYLSAGLLDLCKGRGIPVVMTIHDFWLGCARFGQLLHPDGSRCAHVDVKRCGTCLPSFKWRQSDLERRVARGISAVKSVTGLDVSGPIRRMAAGGRPAPSEGWAPPSEEEAARFEAQVASRLEDLVPTLRRCVDRVLLPARFMVPWFEELGLDPARLHVETTGVDWDGARCHPRVERGAGEPVRVLFLGSLVPHKAPHLLLEAWGKLPEALRGAARLRVLGPDQHDAGYVDGLRQVAEPLGVTVGGALGREEVRAEMARTDVLVTPSQWTEIRPLVMLEAFAAGARVVATDLGGMAELLADGLPGSLFEEGDVEGLRAALAAELEMARDAPSSGAAATSAASTVSSPGPTPRFRAWSEVGASLIEHYDRAVRGDRAPIG
ncbi:glycosyltransferase [Planctomycetota bacterium]|nr:glycosyltransferase [Planctomycetota bacterium]